MKNTTTTIIPNNGSSRALNPQNISAETSGFRERVRKVVILLLLFGLLVPTLLFNIGANAEQAGWSGPLLKFSEPLPSLTALLLCQRWTLFSDMTPCNFTMHFEVELRDGRMVQLRDLDKERAGKWQSILFPNEPKAELNLYSDPSARRRYLEYLVRTSGLNPAEIARRVIYIRYQNIFPRDQAAAIGTHYGPEAKYALDSY
jgi:hypothetical protein